MGNLKYIKRLDNKIKYLTKEISIEENAERKSKLLDELQIVKHQRQIAEIRRLIQQIENRK